MDETDTFAPAGMGKEYVSQPRKPLSEYAGASFEMDVASFFRGAAPEPWDPMGFSQLYKVSRTAGDRKGEPGVSRLIRIPTPWAAPRCCVAASVCAR